MSSNVVAKVVDQLKEFGETRRGWLGVRIQDVTPDVAELRGIPVGVDCWSPNRHSASSDADSLLDFVELLAETSGRPIAVKSAPTVV